MVNARVLLLHLGVLVTWVGCAARVASAPPPSREAQSFVRNFPDVNASEVIGIARQIENGPRDLASQRAAARREGLRLTLKDLQTAVPPPERNAAPVYARLMNLLKERPLDPATDPVRGSLGVNVAHAPEDVERVRKLVAERQDVMALVHEATDKPECVFRRDWSLGPMLLFPELPKMREAVRLLRAESYFLAREGRYPEAVATMARGFRIVEHVTATPVVIGYLVGIACESISLAGMEDILCLSGANAEVAESVRAAIAAHRLRFSVRRMLESELVLYSAGMDTLRRGGRETALRLTREAGVPGAVPPGTLPEFTPAEKRVWSQFLDAGEARFLSTLRRVIAASDKPYLIGKPLLERLSAAGDAASRNPVEGLASAAGVIASAISKGVWARAREEVLMAGAVVMAHKARHGTFPGRLQDAMPQPPLDPFGSGPLIYRREGEGFVLYSIGVSGRFDGGRPGVRSGAGEAYLRYPPVPLPPRRD